MAEGEAEEGGEGGIFGVGASLVDLLGMCVLVGYTLDFHKKISWISRG